MSNEKLNPLVTKAIKSAQAKWGQAGWMQLTDDMKNAYVCQAVIGLLAAVDYSEFSPEARADGAKLFSKLERISEITTQAIQFNQE